MSKLKEVDKTMITVTVVYLSLVFEVLVYVVVERDEVQSLVFLVKVDYLLVLH